MVGESGERLGKGIGPLKEITSVTILAGYQDDDVPIQRVCIPEYNLTNTNSREGNWCEEGRLAVAE